jgi:adenylate cyclase class 1
LSPRDLVVVCHTPVRAKSITLRVESLFSTLVKLFSKSHRSRLPRYILAGESGYYLFEMNNKVLGFKLLLAKEQLLKELASPKENFSPIHFDQAMPENTPIPLIFTLNKPKIIQLFYQKHKTDISVYIIDERGALYTQKHGKSDINQLLHQYSKFFQAILNRNLFNAFLTLEYYEIQKNSAGILSCSEVYIKATSFSNRMNLRISGETTARGINYTIYCNENEFSSLDYGNQLFFRVYQHILQSRQSKLDYPVHITDIDLPLSAFHIDRLEQLQTIHYLNYKQKIEAKLNV